MLSISHIQYRINLCQSSIADIASLLWTYMLKYIDLAVADARLAFGSSGEPQQSALMEMKHRDKQVNRVENMSRHAIWPLFANGHMSNADRGP